MEFKIEVKQPVKVKHLKAQMDVRYWEDATVNGVEEDNDNPKIPFSGPDGWNITIDLETGKIVGWPEGIEAQTHYKVCDAGRYSLLSESGEIVADRYWYVPGMLSPGDDGFGDYVIMKIDGSGKIEHWSADLSFFDECEDD